MALTKVHRDRQLQQGPCGELQYQAHRCTGRSLLLRRRQGVCLIARDDVVGRHARF